MLSLRQLFIIIKNIIDSNNNNIKTNILLIRDLFNNFCIDLTIHNSSIIKLTNSKIVKIYNLHNKNIIVSDINGSNYNSFISDNLGFMIFDDIFINNMSFFGCDYLLNLDVSYLFNNDILKKTPDDNINNYYKSFYHFITERKFIDYNSNNIINNRIFLICVIASKIVYDNNIFSRYIIKKINDDNYEMTLNDNININSYTLHNIDILKNDSDLIILFIWNDLDCENHIVNYAPIISDLYKLINNTDNFINNNDNLKINCIKNIGQLKYYLLYDKITKKFILSIRGTDSKSITSNCGINIQLVINSVRHYYKQKTLILTTDDEKENILNQIYLYLTNILSNFIKDSSFISDIFDKHIKLDLIVQKAESFINQSMPSYLKPILISKVKLLCETSKIMNILNGFIYSKDAYNCLCSIYKIVITENDILCSDIIKIFDKLIELFSVYLSSIISNINNIIKNVNWLIMVIPNAQYLNIITCDYIKKIFDFDIEENNIDKLFFIILQTKFSNKIKQFSELITNYINNNYLENSLQYSKTIVEICYTIIYSIDRNPITDLIITGHSLGGGLTQYLSACYSNLGITFNPVGAKILIKELDFHKLDEPIYNNIEFTKNLFNKYITNLLKINLENKFQIQIVDFKNKIIDESNISSLLINNLFDNICKFILPILIEDYNNDLFKEHNEITNFNVINLVITQDLVHQIKFSSFYDNLHIGDLFILSETSDNITISSFREIETLYILSYDYKINYYDKNIEDIFNNYFVNASELLDEFRNYAINLTTFHGIIGLSLFLIRILSKIDNDIYLHYINKKLISEPLFTPVDSCILKMYKCSVLSNTKK
jgi:hypothetical protein